MKLTIFTPTYNRADKLNKVYNSLVKQDCIDFEWLIIDDGSSDNTEEVVNSFISEAPFIIRYFKKTNGGKHTAHNMALELASGKYFMCLDSDDYLADNILKELSMSLCKLSFSEGLIAYKSDIDGRLLSSEFPENIELVTTFELTSKYNCRGEFVLIYPTEILGLYPFPVYDNERFITECVLYDRLDAVCKMQFLRKTLMICEYQVDGYSQNLNKIMKENPMGYCMYFMQRIDLQDDLIKKLIYAAKYWSFRIFSRNNKCKYMGKNNVLTLVALPIGCLFWLYYKIIRGF